MHAYPAPDPARYADTIVAIWHSNLLLPQILHKHSCKYCLICDYNQFFHHFYFFTVYMHINTSYLSTSQPVLDLRRTTRVSRPPAIFARLWALPQLLQLLVCMAYLNLNLNLSLLKNWFSAGRTIRTKDKVEERLLACVTSD